jgi:pimeloyl-ACP methyl ester carboxylesterase
MIGLISKSQRWNLAVIKTAANFPQLAKRVCDTSPKCELVLLPGIGHVPHFEAPDMFYKALLKFLKS